jgi:predicted nucleic acid-binding Zn ribbon protein
MKAFDINKRNELICNARRTGATMREIGEKMGISRERVRQILAKNLGSTIYPLLSTQQLCDMSGISKKRLVTLQKQGLIQPELTRSVEKYHYSLWALSIPEEIEAYCRTHYRCLVCGHPLPGRRRQYCSDACVLERYKYKNKTQEEKRRSLDSIKRYRERKRSEAKILTSALMTVGI